MNKKFQFFFLIVSGFYFSATAQNLILNGSFESNDATVNAIALTWNWQDTIQNSWEIDGGTMDLITTNSCADPSEGNWFVSCNQSVGGWPYMAFSLKLASSIVAGSEYKLLFDKIFCGPNSSQIDIGLSNDSTLMGTALHTFSFPTSGNWVTDTFDFTASISAKYLTVNVGVTGGTGTIGLDNFILTSTSTSVQNLNELENVISVFPNPVSDFLNVTFNNSYQGNKIALIDLTGRVLKTIFVLNESNLKINLSDLASGIYFLKCFDGFTVKVMKL